MFRKIHNYLLLHYPLLWNTKVVPVLTAALFLHVLFFISGALSMSPYVMTIQSDVESAGSFSMYTFSILCSIALLIGWLTFYLRNNAYKQFYIIPRHHLAAEFAIITLIMVVTTNFFESYNAGTAVRVRSITSKQELKAEINTFKMAEVFLPVERSRYFKYNSCNTFNSGDQSSYNSNSDYFDSTNSDYHTPNFRRMRSLISEPGAFSYRHYCEADNYRHWNISNSAVDGVLSDYQQREVINRLIARRDKDSINNIIRSFVDLSKKYGITQSFNAANKADWVFEDSLNTVNHLMATDYYQPDTEEQRDTVHLSGLYSALSMAEDANEQWFSVRSGRIIAELYFALGFAMLIFLYRLFSRRIILISILASIIILIFMMLVGNQGSDSSAWFLYCFLTLIFMALALVAIANTARSIAGVFLTLHLFMLLGLMPVIITLIEQRYYRLAGSYRYQISDYVSDTVMPRDYPFTAWVHDNNMLLIGLNLLFVFLYTAFVYTRVSVKQHMLPHE